MRCSTAPRTRSSRPIARAASFSGIPARSGSSASPPWRRTGQSLDLIIPENLRARHWAGYRHTMETGTSRYGHGDLLSVPGLTKDGRRISVEFTIVLLRNAQQEVTGTVAVMRDVTKRFEEVRELKRQLAQAGIEIMIFCSSAAWPRQTPSRRRRASIDATMSAVAPKPNARIAAAATAAKIERARSFVGNQAPQIAEQMRRRLCLPIAS